MRCHPYTVPILYICFYRDLCCFACIAVLRLRVRASFPSLCLAGGVSNGGDGTSRSKIQHPSSLRPLLHHAGSGFCTFVVIVVTILHACTSCHGCIYHQRHTSHFLSFQLIFLLLSLPALYLSHHPNPTIMCACGTDATVAGSCSLGW